MRTSRSRFMNYCKGKCKMKTEEKKKELLQEAKIKIKIYKALLKAIEENGGMFAKAMIEGKLQAEKTFVKIMEN